MQLDNNDNYFVFDILHYFLQVYMI